MPELPQDRRRTARATVAARRELAVPVLLTLQILDISMSGALLSSEPAVSVGQRAELRAVLDGDPFVVQVEIRHVGSDPRRVPEPGRVLVGVEFVALDYQSQGCIQRFLKQKAP